MQEKHHDNFGLARIATYGIDTDSKSKTYKIWNKFICGRRSVSHQSLVPIRNETHSRPKILVAGITSNGRNETLTMFILQSFRRHLARCARHDGPEAPACAA